MISPSATISAFADIEPSVRGTRVLVGDRTSIDAFVKIKPTGGEGDVVIGTHCVINSGTVIYSGNGVKIGNGVLIAANCTIAPVNHAYQDARIPIREQGFQPSRGGIVIGDDVWLGANCVVLDGADVGHGAVVGAGSVVRGKLEPLGVFVGNPMRQLASRS